MRIARTLRSGARGLLVCLALAATVLAVPAAALAEEAYTYTVRFYAGAQGSFGGSPVAEFTGLSYGDRVSFDPSSVSVTDAERYYVRGIREAGLDNDTVGATSFVVTEDADYVVAYGIKGDMVEYTVNFVDEAGNTLEESRTFVGNVGDKPVVACVYVEGYQPEYPNLTKTLSANAAENVFDFVYTALPVEERVTTETVTETVAAPAAPGAAAGAAAGAAGAPAAAAGDGAVAQVTPGDAAGADATAIGDDANPLAAADPAAGQVEEIGDLDTPLASGLQGMLGGYAVPVVAGCVVVAALVAAALLRRKREE